MDIFDFHTHIFPDSLAERAIAKLAYGAHIRPLTDGTLFGTAEYLKSEGVTGFLVCNIATNAKQQISVNDFALKVQASGIAESFGSVYPHSDTAMQELQRIADAGLCGIKLHPEYQEFDADDPKVFPVYEYCRDKGMTIVMHAGLDAAFPNSLRASAKAINRVTENFPELKLVAAHFGGWMKFEDVLKELLPAKNLYLDTSCAAGFIDPQIALAIIKKHGAEKIVFGSDCPWGSPAAHVRLIDGFDLTETEKEMIFSKNAKRLLPLGIS